MTKFISDRRLITERILSLIKPNPSSEEIHDAFITWWQNFRESGGFSLSYAGSMAFEKAEIEYTEFEMGSASYSSMMSTVKILNDKMPVPYYFYANKGKRMIKIYDSRVSVLVILYGGVKDYLDKLEDRRKK